VHHDREEITHRFDAMAVDGHGRIVIAWIDKRDLIAAEASDKRYLGGAVYYSWSNDGGASFVPERKLVDEICECCRIALSLTPQGDVVVRTKQVWIVWNQVSAAGYALTARHSIDHGVHFDTARKLAHSNGAVGCPQLLLKPNATLVGWNTAAGFRVVALDASP
jgi:hypothetical protein